MQPPDAQRIIFNGIWKNLDGEDISPQLIESLYAPVRHWLNDATRVTQAKMLANGQFNSKPLHRCSMTEWMTDTQLSLLMPADSGGYVSLSPFSTNDPTTIQSLSEVIPVYLALAEIRAISIPVGPGHWRHVTISKRRDHRLNVEIMDSFGVQSARKIQHDVIRLLKASGLKYNEFEIKLIKPKRQQEDGYACGDFTVAYAHCIAKQAGSTKTNQTIIDTLSKHGNTNGALRQVMRQTSAAKCNETLIDSSTAAVKRISPDSEIEMTEIKFKRTRDSHSTRALVRQGSQSLFSEQGTTDSSGSDSDLDLKNPKHSNL